MCVFLNVFERCVLYLLNQGVEKVSLDLEGKAFILFGKSHCSTMSWYSCKWAAVMPLFLVLRTNTYVVAIQFIAHKFLGREYEKTWRETSFYYDKQRWTCIRFIWVLTLKVSWWISGCMYILVADRLVSVWTIFDEKELPVYSFVFHGTAARRIILRTKPWITC